MRSLLAVLIAAVLLGTVASSGAAQRAPAEKTPAPKKANRKTPPADPYAGKTVRDGRDGMGLADYREKRAPKVGQIAPALRLKRADGKGVIDLASFKGKRDVVLVFGSYT